MPKFLASLRLPYHNQVEWDTGFPFATRVYGNGSVVTSGVFGDYEVSSRATTENAQGRATQGSRRFVFDEVPLSFTHSCISRVLGTRVLGTVYEEFWGQYMQFFHKLCMLSPELPRNSRNSPGTRPRNSPRSSAVPRNCYATIPFISFIFLTCRLRNRVVQGLTRRSGSPRVGLNLQTAHRRKSAGDARRIDAIR